MTMITVDDDVEDAGDENCYDYDGYYDNYDGDYDERVATEGYSVANTDLILVKRGECSPSYYIRPQLPFK